MRGAYRRRRGWAAGRPDRGSAVVEFVLVAVLLTVVFLGIVQFGIVLHVRNVLTANAAEGARFAASLGTDPGAGGSRTAELNRTTLSAGIASRVPCRGSADGLLVAVDCQGQIPLSVLHLGTVSLHVRGHALKEPDPEGLP